MKTCIPFMQASMKNPYPFLNPDAFGVLPMLTTPRRQATSTPYVAGIGVCGLLLMKKVICSRSAT